MEIKRSNDPSLRVQIPVIDISEAGEAETADQLVDAVVRYGFVFIKGEGIVFTRQDLDDVFALVRPEKFLNRLQTILMILDSQKNSSRQL